VPEDLLHDDGFAGDTSSGSADTKVDVESNALQGTSSDLLEDAPDTAMTYQAGDASSDGPPTALDDLPEDTDAEVTTGAATDELMSHSGDSSDDAGATDVAAVSAELREDALPDFPPETTDAEELAEDSEKGDREEVGDIDLGETHDALARQRLEDELDAGVIAKLERDFGELIPDGKLAEAKSDPTTFQSHEHYQEGLTVAYPDAPSNERQCILGDLRDGVVPYVDSEQVGLPTTVAHERLHQLSSEGFREQVGKALDEGTTELLAREEIPGLPLQNDPEVYPRETRLAGMLEARVGPELETAYFTGDVGPMRHQVDAQLGNGAYDRIAASARELDMVGEAAREGRLDEVEKLLKADEPE
jgi:hypothetical protein